MALSVRTVNYFYTRIQAEPGKPYELLARLADEDVNLLAFSAVPYGPNHVELTIFPDRIDSFLKVAKELGLVLTGPQHAVLINGDDHLGTLAEVLKTLLDAGVDIYASTGVTDGQGGYGYVIYFKEGRSRACYKGIGKVSGLRPPGADGFASSRERWSAMPTSVYTVMQELAPFSSITLTLTLDSDEDLQHYSAARCHHSLVCRQQ